jgi:N-acetyl sugar amidotransferase
VREGKNKQYDAIMGVSGGVDSTYLAYMAYQQGLRILLVHCDNGWNTETSVRNIENIIKKTNYDLHTVVLNWDEFRDIQISFFKAGVVDIELPYDYALMISMYLIAIKYNIHNILSGHNLVTEGTYMPKSWVHSKMDIINIKAIHSKFGKMPMKTFPHLSPWVYSYYELTKRFHRIALLNYMEYDKAKAKEIITEKLNWSDYGGKHYESVFTRFYQGYILPQKFHIDKRQFHLSTLICSGQISREQALQEMNNPTYVDESLFVEDFEYVKKKLGFTDASWESYMKEPAHKHQEYANISSYWKKYYKVIGVLKPFEVMLRTLEKK